MSGIKNKCTCGMNKSRTCPTCSVLKMVILLKNKQQHLKNVGPEGKLVNPVWYNYLKSNGKSVDELISIMKRRFLNSKFVDVTNVIMFYDNRTKQLIKKIKCS
ncbi:hypothetical protein LNJ03_11165 [Tenacibaculum dicentrarchi]|nr:hypothetical protein [Tenacibaculum dicentrarchi]